MIEWNKYVIGELVDLSQGQVINAQTNHLVVKEGIPLLRITDMINGTKTVFIDEEKVSKKNVAKPEDIIYTRTGQVGLVFKKQFGVVHNNCFKVIPKDERINREFLFWFLKTKAIYEYVNGVASGSAQPDLPHGSFKSITINLPPLPTQQRIASILSAYDELIEINNQRIKLLEETTRELYKEWFVRLRFPGYKKAKFIKGVPEGFGEIKYFMDFIKLNRGFDLPEDKIKEGQYPVVASTSIKAYHNQYKVKAPIITTGRSGSLGTVLYINQDGWPLNTSLYVKDFKGNEPLYVFFTLKNIDFESFNSGAGVPSLNQNHLHKLKLWIANKELQLKFKDFVEPIFQQIDNLNQQNTQLRQIRDRLLPRLISGKLEVKEK